jgi:hypothetical protein
VEGEDISREERELATAELTRSAREEEEKKIADKKKKLADKITNTLKRRVNLGGELGRAFPSYEEFADYNSAFNNADKIQLPYNDSQRLVCYIFKLNLVFFL